MRPRLIAIFEKSGNNPNQRSVSNIDQKTEESVYPFSPVRKRKTPKPPPKVEIYVESTKNCDKARALDKDRIRKLPSQKNKKQNRRTMDDYQSSILGVSDNFMFAKQPGTFASIRQNTADLVDISQDFLEFSNGNSSSDQTLNHQSSLIAKNSLLEKDRKIFAPPKRSNKKRTKPDCLRGDSSEFGGLKQMRRLFDDLKETEEIEGRGFGKNSKTARQAREKLKKWNWLLKWLDLSVRTKKQTEKKPFLRQTKKTSSWQKPMRVDGKTMRHHKSENIIIKTYPIISRVKPKLGKNEGIDLNHIKKKKASGSNQKSDNKKPK